MRQLLTRGIFRDTNSWAELGYRTRRMVINTNLLPLDQAPKTFSEVTNARWRGKVAPAYPLFGTTSTYFFAWRQNWGDDRRGRLGAARWRPTNLRSWTETPWRQNWSGRGEAWIGFADSDDIAEEQKGWRARGRAASHG